MDVDQYRAFTDELTSTLGRDPRVLGLVAVGSMAERDYAPDEWSDHDFFVVTEPGAQEALRADLGWLPRGDEIALAYRETEHGVKVLYEDGHLLEFAVFDLRELGLASVNRYRVLLDRGGVAARVEEVARETAARPRPDETFLFGQLVTHALVGALRFRRGERLSGAEFAQRLAVRDAAALLARVLPAERGALLDDLDPLRRFELVHPELGAELGGLDRADPARAARGLLDLVEREVRPLRPDLPWAALDAARRRL